MSREEYNSFIIVRVSIFVYSLAKQAVTRFTKNLILRTKLNSQF